MSVPGLVFPDLVTAPIQCVPYAFFWSGGIPPYTFQVFNMTIGLNETITGLTEPNVEWAVNVPGGTKFGFTIDDSSGAGSAQAAFTVQDGTDPTCLALRGTPTLALKAIPAVTGASETVTATSTTTQKGNANSAAGSHSMKAKIVIGGALASAALSLIL